VNGLFRARVDLITVKNERALDDAETHYTADSNKSQCLRKRYNLEITM